MRTSIAVALLLCLSACGGADSDEDDAPKLTAKNAEAQTCKEVRAGIDDFNRQDYAATVKHFEKAKVTAKVYAKVNTEPEADALLDAVEYYANLDPADYPEAARSSESFARNKEITLTQCVADGEPVAPVPTPV